MGNFETTTTYVFGTFYLDRVNFISLNNSINRSRNCNINHCNHGSINLLESQFIFIHSSLVTQLSCFIVCVLLITYFFLMELTNKTGFINFLLQQTQDLTQAYIEYRYVAKDFMCTSCILSVQGVCLPAESSSSLMISCETS